MNKTFWNDVIADTQGLKGPTVDRFATPEIETHEERPVTIPSRIESNETARRPWYKRAATSKINLTVFLGMVFWIVSIFGVDLTPEIKAQITNSISAIVAILVMLFRTFANNPE